ncbi:MAG: hypothetical protein J4451_00440 [DPANN group archaeon]|nr:hypothetical protein [DPANN group archaeon]
MKFIINYSDTSFRRYMSRRSVNPFITKTEKIVLKAMKDLRINPKKVPVFILTFRHGKIDGDANLTRYPEHRIVELTVNLHFIRYSDNKAVRNIIYHELGHLRDMIDPRFNYRPAKVDNMSAHFFKKFVTLWNISIDSRLNKKRLPSAIWGRKEDIVYFGISDKIVKKIWGKRITYNNLVKYAKTF